MDKIWDKSEIVSIRKQLSHTQRKPQQLGDKIDRATTITIRQTQATVTVTWSKTTNGKHLARCNLKVGGRETNQKNITAAEGQSAQMTKMKTQMTKMETQTN